MVGNVVATQKNAKLEGAKLMLVQPLDLDGKPRGAAVLAIDGVDAGIGDRVLLVQDGKAAMQVAGPGLAAVDAAIVGVVDAVDAASDLMDDARIATAARRRCWATLDAAPAGADAPSGLEARVAAWRPRWPRSQRPWRARGAAASPRGRGRRASQPAGPRRPGRSGDRCVLEPDKPACRATPAAPSGTEPPLRRAAPAAA